MNPAFRKFVVPFLIVDAIFVVALALWFFHFRSGGILGSAQPDIQVRLRKTEEKLTEVDLVNGGAAAGALNDIAVEVTWPDADLDDAKGLSQFSESDTGRRSVTFAMPASAPAKMLQPNEPIVIGWVRLTDDVPTRAQIVPASTVTTQP